MRWTDENEQILWKLIFETQTITLDLDKVAQAWPGDDKPTPKAIERHLEKYRKSGSGVSFQKGQQKRADAEAGPATPSKKRKKAAKSAKAGKDKEEDKAPAAGAAAGDEE
ncbi:uncharacterized protein BO66DRAFT_458467 [Aspergillus aculeatinus CBS 121060]|uniref:Uncharacterized protein n=1 Tax=Aspergillus aculeatinus CBS 121060 TaxID=1448322 RepID=A0ACD1H0D4_9EURO|nr:hypothetical protein BO66DRAFT_458467 [Aspergillus aculeatinus CBS 121060]RAH67002.1 hypothetical protein BO66DRAFT_458467 [Aspergillus aculeatinus CBS 121060]